MKYVPNLLTCFRILSSAVLLFLQPLSAPFFFVYALCGATDMLDGFIARKTGSAGKTGAILDSIADMVFIAVALFIFIPAISFTAGMIAWIIVVAIIRIISLIVGYLKYRQFAGLHTYANKAAGLILFCFPFIYRIGGLNQTAYLTLAITSISAIEELAIQITSPSLNRDTKSIFTK